MTDQQFQRPPRRSTGPRITAVVVGSIVGLFAFAFLAAGGALLWGDAKKDDQGYISTGTDRFATTTNALATENLDIDLDGVDSVVSQDLYGKVRLQATSRTDKPVFVGIARTSDVNAFLSGTAYTSVTDVSYSPFDPAYQDHAGTTTPAPPAGERFWAASANGAGTQTLTWDVEDGNWSVVVMNADGSAGVDAGIRAGANVPILDEIAWFSTGTGIVLLITAAGLIYLGVRRRPAPPAETQAMPAETVAV